MNSTESNLIGALAELAGQVRATTLQLLTVPDQSWLTWSPAGTSNHILWHAGHAVWVNDALTVRPLTGKSELPNGWAAIFGQNSKPAMVTQWPDEAQVRVQLQSQLTHVLELLTKNAESIAANAHKSPPEGGWPLLPGMIHGWHDEARHQGEMYLLHKLRRAS